MKITKAKPRRTCRPVTLTLKLTTIARLEREVQRGSWSAVIDKALNDYLDSQPNPVITR
jgi:hypothetical protein